MPNFDRILRYLIHDQRRQFRVLERDRYYEQRRRARNHAWKCGECGRVEQSCACSNVILFCNPIMAEIHASRQS